MIVNISSIRRLKEGDMSGTQRQFDPQRSAGSCSACGARRIRPIGKGIAIEATIYLSVPARCIVRAYVDLDPSIVVHPFEIAEIGKFRGSPGFRWRVKGKACTLFPAEPLLNLQVATDYLAFWAEGFVSSEFKKRKGFIIA